MLIRPNGALVDRRSQVRRRHDDSVSGSNTRCARGLCTRDRLLAANEEPPLGAHLITPRFAYAHHRVYVGAGAVVHYRAFASHWRRGPVEEVSLSRFAHSHPVWVRPAGPDALRREEIVRRARSRLGENRYRLLSNNCEHFSEWCVHGKHTSPQAERLLARIRRVSRALSELMRWTTMHATLSAAVSTSRSPIRRGRQPIPDLSAAMPLRVKRPERYVCHLRAGEVVRADTGLCRERCRCVCSPAACARKNGVATRADQDARKWH